MALPIQLLKLMGLSLLSAIVLELLQWLIVFRHVPRTALHSSHAQPSRASRPFLI